jgi:hypothetical protein
VQRGIAGLGALVVGVVGAEAVGDAAVAGEQPLRTAEARTSAAPAPARATPRGTGMVVSER